MSEFGHFGCIVPFNGGGICIDAWGAGPFVIEDGRRSWRFEFSDRFGPLLVDEDGEPLDDQPVSESDPFWGPFNAWLVRHRATHDHRSDGQ